MKQTTLIALLLITIFQSKATITIKNSNVTDVTIYRSYAKETRIGNGSIPEGNSEVIISNISTNIDENSIQVGCKNNVKILSVSSRLNYINDQQSKQSNNVKMWQDSIKLLDRKSRFIATQKTNYESELALLKENNKLGSNTESMKPSLLKELLELNRTKQAEISKLIFDANEDYNEMRNSMATLQSQINETNAQAQGKAVREIVLKVNSKSEVNTQFKVSYIITTASWSPTYEIRCENTSKPLQLSCRAKITQTSGYDWKNVRLKLSTANPNQNHNRPILYPIYVDFMQPDYYKQKLGYQANAEKKLAAAPAVEMSNMMYGKDKESFVDGMKIDDSKVTIAQGDLMVEYEINEEQDIESDGQEHIIAIQELTIPAQYNHHAVPKLENAVFLLARITDWGKFNLLAGDATLFFDDMYVGKSYINPNISSDTLLISLGRDEKVTMKRTKLNELCTTKKFSNKKKETKAYETVIKNLKNTPIELELLDQYPIARNNEIEVTLEEAEGAEISKDYGKLLWRIKLQPGETKKIRLMYTIKFDEDKFVSERN